MNSAVNQMSGTAEAVEPTDVDDLRELLKDFVLDLSDRLSNRELEDLLSGREENITSRDLGMKPERHLEQELINPLFDLLGIEHDPQAFGQSGGKTIWPDFRVTNIDPVIIGENKKYNNIDEGVDEIKEYLDRKSVGAEYGVVTDGFEWRMFKIELGGDYTQYPEVHDPIELDQVLLSIAREVNILTSTSIDPVDVDEELQEFLDVYDYPNLSPYVSKTAPRLIRDERKRDVEEFYDLYIELLFGEGDDHGYETSLMDDIEVPSGVTERDSRLFAVTLMNRLLFIKFLESREVLDDGFLKQRVEFYEANSEHIAGSLYSSQIKPLFYNLFNAKMDNRREKYQTGWFSNVPYLNGGLFRASLPKEQEFDVGDRILPEVISDLIEGSKLSLNGGGLDPAIIGSVFEKTINHIETKRNDDDAQKQKGAYYTPSDVTEIVVGRAVDPKLKDTLVETWVSQTTDDEEAQSKVRNHLENDLTLEEILQKIEDNDENTLIQDSGENIRIEFGDEDIINEAMDRVGGLKVLDPACGSGHFLTAAMDEIYRAQLSLLRGQRDDGEIDPNDRFSVKRDLALDVIYGLDADQVATEIAKLRVWLKIVEGNSWDPEFGRLPNIDVNIRDGNSLIGLPLQGAAATSSLELPNIEDRIDDILGLRQEYKDEQKDDKSDIVQLEDEIRPKLDRAYLDQMNIETRTSIVLHEDDDWAWDTKVEEWNALVESVDGALREKIHRVKVKREDGSTLTDTALDELDDLGFNTHKKSASLDIKNRERSLRDSGDNHPKLTIKEELASVLDGPFEEEEDHEGYEFVEIRRRPLSADYDNMFGVPAHWAAEFPEARPEGGSPTDIAFDVIVGNPPYGDLLTENEDALTDTYKTAGEDIVAVFLERQLSLLDDDGYIGNVASLKIAYKDSMETLHDIFREKLDPTKISCFAKRPSCVFEGVEVRIAVLSGQRADHGEDETGTIETSEFLRFDDSIDRDDRLRGVTHRPVDGFNLYEGGIDGYGDHVALAKIGTERIEGILAKVKTLGNGENGEEGDEDESEDEDASDAAAEAADSEEEDDDDSTLNIIRHRVADDETDHVIWRREGQDYFVNPMREELYGAREVKPFHFPTDLEARAAFLGVGSSLFYVYWCAYGDMYHLNLSHVRCFPIPPLEDLREIEDEIVDVSDRLWEEMETGFDSSKNEFDYEPMKPIIDEADELLGPLYGLTDEEIEFLQGYHNLYGRKGPDDHDLDEFDSDSDGEQAAEAASD